MSEKNRRTYYQDIVYKVCNLLDKHYGRKPGTGLVCGTIDKPSSEVQDELATLLNEHSALKREIEGLSQIADTMNNELAALKRENKQLLRALGHSRYGGHRHLALGCAGCDLITTLLTAEEQK